MAEDAVKCEPLSLLTGKNTGIYVTGKGNLAGNSPKFRFSTKRRRHENREFFGYSREPVAANTRIMSRGHALIEILSSNQAPQRFYFLFARACLKPSKPFAFGLNTRWSRALT